MCIVQYFCSVLNRHLGTVRLKLEHSIRTTTANASVFAGTASLNVALICTSITVDFSRSDCLLTLNTINGNRSLKSVGVTLHCVIMSFIP